MVDQVRNSELNGEIENTVVGHVAIRNTFGSDCQSTVVYQFGVTEEQRLDQDVRDVKLPWRTEPAER